jgi:glutamate-5-semialdehyde dehydrogenase
LDLVEPLFSLYLEKNVEIRADKKSYEKFSGKSKIKLAKSSDYGEEFLDLVVSIKTVKTIDEAINHIEKYGSKHSEAIITKDEKQANYFLEKVDASAVFHNTSTRFNDGFELGLGAEVAVSTDKLHARGPMGINDLMTYKWVVLGEGQIRS